MKILKKVFALALVLAISLSLVACGSSIEGTWTAEIDGVKRTITFEKDGNGECSIGEISYDMTYEIDGDEITIIIDKMGETSEDTLTYEIDGDTLKLTDGDTVEYTRED